LTLPERSTASENAARHGRRRRRNGAADTKEES